MLTVPRSTTRIGSKTVSVPSLTGPNRGFHQMNHAPRRVLIVDADWRLVRDMKKPCVGSIAVSWRTA